MLIYYKDGYYYYLYPWYNTDYHKILRNDEKKFINILKGLTKMKKTICYLI